MLLFRVKADMPHKQRREHRIFQRFSLLLCPNSRIWASDQQTLLVQTHLSEEHCAQNTAVRLNNPSLRVQQRSMSDTVRPKLQLGDARSDCGLNGELGAVFTRNESVSFSPSGWREWRNNTQEENKTKTPCLMHPRDEPDFRVRLETQILSKSSKRETLVTRGSRL